MDMVRRSLLGAGLCLIAVALPATGATAAERVTDGGFETATTCAAGHCKSTAWTAAGIGADFCGPGGAPTCGGAGSPRSGSFSGLFVHGFIDSDDVPPGYMTLSYLEQNVPIPAAPAVLRFYVGHSNGAGVEKLDVRLDGKVISTPEADGAAARPYTLYEVDVSQFAGPGTHSLRFEYGCINTCAGVFLDDVSLDAADVPPEPVEPEPEPEPATCGGRVATITGTDAAETIPGTPGPDVIAALGGDDVVKAGGGADLVCGGAGNDRLSGQGGRDTLLGEDGKDRLNGGKKRDLCDGGNGRDRAGASCEKVPA